MYCLMVLSTSPIQFFLQPRPPSWEQPYIEAKQHPGKHGSCHENIRLVHMCYIQGLLYLISKNNTLSAIYGKSLPFMPPMKGTCMCGARSTARLALQQYRCRHTTIQGVHLGMVLLH